MSEGEELLEDLSIAIAWKGWWRLLGRKGGGVRKENQCPSTCRRNQSASEMARTYPLLLQGHPVLWLVPVVATVRDVAQGRDLAEVHHCTCQLTF